MANTLDPSEIIDLLKEKAQKALGSSLGSKTLEPFRIGAAGNVPYNFQDTLDVTKFNDKTYTWINHNLKQGTKPFEFDQGTSFTNLYLKAILSISYKLSENDTTKLNDAATNTTQQAAAVQNKWIEAFGKLPDGAGVPIDNITAVILTWSSTTGLTLQKILQSTNLDDLMDKAPASGQAVLPVFVDYLNAFGSAISLKNSVSLNNAYLKRAQAAIQNPTVANGGMTLADGTTVVPAFRVTPQNSEIQNSIKSGKPPVSLSMNVKKSSSNEFTVSVEGRAGFKVDWGFISVKGQAGANYFSSDIATESNQTDVTMTFPGVNLVTFGPLDFQATGASKYWFWMDPIKEAIRNGNKDVSGYKWDPDPKIDFSKMGPFSYLEGVAISGYPTIEIKVKSANYKRIQQDFSQFSNVGVSAFGIEFASVSEKTSSSKVSVDEASQTVTITISPPPTLVGGTVKDSLGWVLGVLPVYPAA